MMSRWNIEKKKFKPEINIHKHTFLFCKGRKKPFLEQKWEFATTFVEPEEDMALSPNWIKELLNL